MTTRIGFVLFPRLTQLDLTGPYEVFGRLPDTQVLLVGREARSDTGLRLQPDATFDAAPQLDVLCVPGGPGVNGAMEDEALLGFLRQQAEKAAWITSVCTGALVLGAAGLLRGYRATTHWLSMDLLPRFGAIPVRERVVVTATGPAAAASPRASTSAFASPPSCAARRWRRKSSSSWSTTLRRRSTRARQRPPGPSWWRRSPPRAGR